ncbi:porphobilinogen synthase [Aquirufa rosea]|uniref:Delta-aminolevulinic acid dehydratase n=1 Tax=Aquirufa rosea TaxID=2509241 RepID=A0A4Q1BZF6_9BACT|nr:porphobilinogen synthase [Aquirufa rosea]RXK48889.1 porphobilinogen synthase [Aquirufa rosea]
MLQRPRRNRQSSVIRSMVEENRLSVKDMMFPLFVMEGKQTQTEISSMPGIHRFTLDLLLSEIESCVKLGIQSFALFPQIPESKKDSMASESHKKGNIYTESIYEISKRFPEISLLTDVAMDPYSSDGHDGVVRDGKILNDETLPVLAKMAIAQAQAGSKLIGPSDMMDGRVGYLRQALDEAGFEEVGIMAYTAKYASAFYGPFRDALESAPKFGDKKTYQMNPANRREALIEAELDEMEGADFLMVKPALAYLDIISLLKENSHLPIAAYNVSGEYAMIKAAAQNGWIDGEKAMLESLLAIKRAGAQVILTYFAKEFAQLKLA